MGEELELVSCNLCGGEEARVRYVVGAFRIVRCLRCDLYYVNPRVPEHAARQIYQNNYFKNRDFFNDGVSHFYGYSDYLDDRSNIERVYKGILERMIHLAGRGHLLEVGSAYGFFLNLARADGWKVAGVEPCLEAASFSKNVLKIETFNGYFSEFPIRDGEYDATAMFDVIEHFHDPSRELGRINRLLKMGGLLVVSSPNVDALPVRILGARWEDLQRAGSNEHLYFFSPATLTRMLACCGFEMLKIDYVKRPFTLAQFLSRLEKLGIPRALLDAALAAVGYLRIQNVLCHVGLRLKFIAYARKVRNQ